MNKPRGTKRARWTKAVVVTLVVAGATAGCGTDGNGRNRSASPRREPAFAMQEEMPHEMAPIPEYAAAWRLTVGSSAADGVVTGNAVDFSVQPEGFVLDCDYAGKASAPGIGQYHVTLDGALIDMECSTEQQVSMQNVKPGHHEIAVVATLNDHTEVMNAEDAFSFEYRPTSPLPFEKGDHFDGRPSIRIVSPTSGTVVSGNFDVVVQVSRLDMDCGLLGKKPVPGYGHWHVNLDSTIGPMMGMATMVGMSCTNVLRVSTKGLTPGSTHKLIALAVNGLHSPLEPPVESSVDVVIG